MAQTITQFVGLDVHKATIVAAMAAAGSAAAESWGTFPHTAAGVCQLVARLGAVETVLCCYEAGPTGYGLQRQLDAVGVRCVVIAPSLIPIRPGDQVKTDRRDALKLARYLRAGELTPVWVPDAEQEGLRDLTRARTTAQRAVVQTKNQLGKFLLRLSLPPPAGVQPWTAAYRAWLQALQLPQPLQQLVLEEARAAVEQSEARLGRLEGALKQAATTSSQAATIAALQTLRGVALVTATALVAEIGDITRFSTAPALMAYAGVVPREHSSGDRQRRGSISKNGNAALRGVIVEAAQHYRRRPHVGPQLKRRQRGQTAPLLAIADNAQRRLYRRYGRLLGRGKSSQQAVVAVARELLGFVWALWRESDAAQAQLADRAGVA